MTHTVRLWDVDTQTQIAKLEGHTDAVNSVAFNPNGRIIVSGSDDTNRAFMGCRNTDRIGYT